MIILSSFASTQALAKLTYAWMGITGIFFTDGKNMIVFDPVVTRPSFFNVIFGSKLKTDVAEVDKTLKTLSVTKADAILISHSHYDHAIDAPFFSKKLGAKLMGSESTLNIGRGAGLAESGMQKFKAGDQIKIGAFKITVIEAVHSTLFFNYQLYAGEITAPLSQPASASAYRIGGTFDFYVEHPDGNFMFHPASNFPERPGLYSGMSAKVVFQGVAGRDSDSDIYEILMKTVGAEKVIPIHFDNFFAPAHADMCGFFPIRVGSFTDFMKAKSLKIEMPRYQQWQNVQ